MGGRKDEKAKERKGIHLQVKVVFTYNIYSMLYLYLKIALTFLQFYIPVI